VILVDANILIYASNESASRHAQARDWLNGRLNSTTRVGLPWSALLAFLRLATNTRVFPRALTMTLAWQQVSDWLACESVWTPEPTEHHVQVLVGCWSSRESTAISLPTPIWPLWLWSTG
jgi:predicted nucleic acid-binding protein